jgi:hypothetical protein
MKSETIRQYNIEVFKELEERAKTNVHAFDKDYFDGAHDLFIILRNNGLLRNQTMEKQCRACEIEANDEQVKQMPMHTCGKDGPVEKVGAMKSETSKKIQDETPQERIEKEAEGLSRIRVWPEQMRVTFKNGYIAGATAEFQRHELERTEMYNKYNEAKQEIANHKAVNSLLLDSSEEAKLANHAYELQSALSVYREVIKELIPMSEKHVQFLDSFTGWIEGDPNETVPDWYAKIPSYKSAIERAKKLIL